MLGLGSFRDLMIITSFTMAVMVLALQGMGKGINGILWSFVLFCALQAAGVVAHYLRFGPLANRKDKVYNTNFE